jgi:putative membrane protein
MSDTRAETLFTDADRQRIASAVATAETRSRGEIVTVVVNSSDDYAVTPWRAGLVGALVGAVGGAAAYLVGDHWGGDPLLWGTLPALGAALLAFLLSAQVEPLRRAWTPDVELQRRVEDRAERAFLEHELFDTRDRSGVLLFLSLFEHRAIVLGDSGINAVVAPGEWQEVVDRMILGIRSGQPAEGVVAAVEKIGPLLDRAGLERRVDDHDELPDEPVIETS